MKDAGVTQDELQVLLGKSNQETENKDEVHSEKTSLLPRSKRTRKSTHWFKKLFR